MARDVDRYQMPVDQTGRIVVDPATRFGKPIVRGTRIGVADILRRFAGGESIETIREDFPHVSREDIVAACVFAADHIERAGVIPKYMVTGDAAIGLLEDAQNPLPVDESSHSEDAKVAGTVG